MDCTRFGILKSIRNRNYTKFKRYEIRREGYSAQNVCVCECGRSGITEPEMPLFLFTSLSLPTEESHCRALRRRALGQPGRGVIVRPSSSVNRIPGCEQE